MPPVSLILQVPCATQTAVLTSYLPRGANIPTSVHMDSKVEFHGCFRTVRMPCEHQPERQQRPMGACRS